MLETLAKLLTMPVDDVRVLLCILAHIPFALLYRAIPSDTPTLVFLRKAYGVLVGVLSCVICYPFFPLVGFVLLAGVFYWLSLHCTDKKTTFIISLLGFAGCCAANIVRLFVDGEGDKIGIDIVYMILTPKIIYFNWHVFAQISAGKSSEIPPVWDYFCYLFNFVGILTTPVYTPAEYDCFIRQKRPEKSINWGRLAWTFLEVCAWLVVFLVIQTNFDLRIIERKEFRSLPFFRQMAQISIEGFYMRARFIAAWKLAYIQVVLVNLRQVDEASDEYVETVDGFLIATSCSPKAIIDHWNMSIQRWLKRCFYLPSIDVFQLTPQRAGLLTLSVSAFWHGFFPTYYLAFLGFNYMIQTEKLVYKMATLRRFFPPIYYRFILDFNAILFKRLPTRRWVPVLKNLWWVYLLNFVVYNLVKIFSRKGKGHRDPRQSLNEAVTGKTVKSATDTEPDAAKTGSEGVRARKGQGISSQ